VVAYERVVILKTIRCTVKVVWVYRQSRWVALYSTDLTLAAQQIIAYYGARWKIEALFKELKRDIGSAETQTRHPQAVSNHLNYCMMAASVAWIYADRIAKPLNDGTPSRAVTILPSRTSEDQLPKRQWEVILVDFSQCRVNLS